MEICLVGAALIQVDRWMGGQVDGYDKANRHFHDCADTPKNA